ncbi:MAG: glycosyltransferase [Nitrospira sp.]|nr:glycosyltransferase [Nitrospira sp.]
MKVSIVIRTYNEERHLPELLKQIAAQHADGISKEVIVVDSGSEDRTRDIAQSFGCRVVRIAKEDFTFGRSLNVGCGAATGRYLVFVSGHCIPASKRWLEQLIRPLEENTCVYTYGRQLGNKTSKFSERQLFKKYFPEVSHVPQEGFFCNNANAALPWEVWDAYRFNEELTGLEDMELGKRLVEKGLKLGYVAEAPVFHLHDESWRKLHRRYEREAIALQKIMPEVQISLFDFLRYAISAVWLDCKAALREGEGIKPFPQIALFRFLQFLGAYQGNHETRKISRALKEKYFYPK